jgi:serine/threonine protein kinase
MATASNTPIIPGYQISSELYAGSRTLVYRAIREHDSLAVVIKLLACSFPNFNVLVVLFDVLVPIVMQLDA